MVPCSKQGDLLVELVDVGWCAEAGFAPGLFAERFGQALDVAGQAAGAFVRGEEVGLEGDAADVRAEVHPVRTDLLSSARGEPQADLGVGPGQQRTAEVVDDHPSQNASPEDRQARRVVRVEGQSQQSGRHLAHARRGRDTPARAFSSAADSMSYDDSDRSADS